MQTMRALTVQPGEADSVRLEQFKVPGAEHGAVLMRAVALGVCGTDREIIAAKYGAPPPGHKRLIIGHESLGRVVEAPADSEALSNVCRRNRPPCQPRALRELCGRWAGWDMCPQRRIHGAWGSRPLDGFGSEYYRLDPEYVMRLLDPSLGT